jgi:hypothetical protein
MKKIYLIFLLIAFTVSNANSELYKSGVLQGGSGSNGASIVEQSDCSTITEGFCVDTDTGDLYYYDTASSSVQVVLTSVGNTPSYLNVRNTSGATITAGKFVKAAGAQGQKILIALADNSNYEDADVIGYTWQSIGNNSNGTIISRGLSTNQSTAAWGIGDGSELYLGTLGVPIETKPTDAVATPIGTLVYANAGAGIVFINPHHPIIGVPEAYSDTNYSGDYGGLTKNDFYDFNIASFHAFTASDTTPSVADYFRFSVDYVDPITDFDDPTEGKIISVYCDVAAVFDVDSGNIVFYNRTTDYTATQGEILQFISLSGTWFCLNAQNETVTSGDSDDLGDFLTDENGTTGGFMRSNADLSSATGAQGDDTVYGAGWNGDGSAPSKNAVYDEMETKQNLLTDGDGLETAIGSETTGTGDFVRATSPTLVAPALGTPASGNLANCTGYPAVDTPSISDIQDADGNNSIDFGSNIITYQLTDDNAELRICDGSDTSDYFYFRKNGTDLEFGVNDDGNDNDIYINLGSIAIEAGTGQLDDGANSAITRVGRTAGESISIGQAVGMASDGTYMLADGSEGATIGKCLGLAADDYGDGSAVTLVSYGVMRNDAWSWSTIGASVFLDDTAGGLVETSTDIDSSETLQFIGTVYSGSELDLNISPDVFMVE